MLDERRDGRPFPALELESLAALARGAAVALYNARRVRGLAERALAEVAERDAPGDAPGDTMGRALAEAAWLAERAARATLVPLRRRRLLAHAIRLGPGGGPGSRTWPLERVAAEDPSGFARDVVALRAAARRGAPDPSGDDARAATLLAVALAYAAERERGADGAAALPRVLAAAGGRLDPITRQALEAAARELALAVGQAA